MAQAVLTPVKVTNGDVPVFPPVGEIVKFGVLVVMACVELSVEFDTVQVPGLELVVKVRVAVCAPVFTVWLTFVHGEVIENVVPLTHAVLDPVIAT